jgi:preprotein translocase subunit YajC
MSTTQSTVASTSSNVTKPAPNSKFDFSSFMPMILMFVVMYFLMIRPQQKRAKDQKDMQSSLKRGDKVATSSGIIGEIDSIDEKEIVLQLESGLMRIMRNHVVENISNLNRVSLSDLKESHNISMSSESVEKKEKKKNVIKLREKK